MNIEQNKNIGICGVTVTFTIAELIVLKGLSENIDCILNPKPETQMPKTSWFNTQEKLRPCNEKIIALINKITNGIQSLDEASNDLFAVKEKSTFTSISDLHEQYYILRSTGRDDEATKTHDILSAAGVSADEILTIYQTNCRR